MNLLLYHPLSAAARTDDIVQATAEDVRGIGWAVWVNSGNSTTKGGTWTPTSELAVSVQE